MNYDGYDVLLSRTVTLPRVTFTYKMMIDGTVAGLPSPSCALLLERIRILPLKDPQRPSTSGRRLLWVVPRKEAVIVVVVIVIFQRQDWRISSCPFLFLFLYL